METNLIPLKEFCSYHKIEAHFIQSLVEYNLIKTKSVKKSVFIKADDLTELERYIRLYKELEINLEGLHAVAHLLQQLELMQNKINALSNEINYYKQLH